MDRMRGIVSAVKHAGRGSDDLYTIVGNKVVQLKNATRLGLYEKVEVELPAQENGRPAKETGSNGQQDLESAIAAIVDSVKLKAPEAGSAGESAAAALAALVDGLRGAARTFLAALVSGAPVLVRFHDDGDGGTGAAALYKAVESLKDRLGLPGDSIIWSMNQGIAYTTSLFYSDTLLLNKFESAVRPLIFIIDFGTSPDSVGSINAAEGKYDFVWIDHHPVYDGFPYGKIKHYINPWLTGGDSNLTAGFVAGCFAEMIGGVDVSELKEASLISDHSSYAVHTTRRSYEIAAVIDALTVSSESPSGQKITPKYMLQVLADENKFGDVLRSAVGQFAEAIDIGMRKAKRYTTASGITVYVLDYASIEEKGFTYVKTGRYSTKLQDKFEEINGDSTITLVRHNGSISIRANKRIAPKVKILSAIEEIKKEFDYFDGGGGHNEAASVRTDREHAGELLGLLLGKLGVMRS